MVYESSYESGRKPFRPDTTRGHWAAPSDFLFACWSLAFKIDVFSNTWYYFFELGIFSLIPYGICMVLFVVPILLIQSFLGQFSSSGFISAFRLAPLFKGMGYISLALNFSILTYYGIFAAIPLIYLLHSMRPSLPWSCENYLEWAKDSPFRGERNICDNATLGATTTMSSTSGENNDTDVMNYGNMAIFHIPSEMFFRSYFKNYSLAHEENIEFSLPWQLVMSMFSVWILVALIFYMFDYSEKMGKLIRYTLWLLLALLSVCLIRLIFLTDAQHALLEFFLPTYVDLYIGLGSIPILAISSFGAGWGSIVSLASYNEFKTNIMRLSWYICLGQLMIFFFFGMTSFLINRHFVMLTNSLSFLATTEHFWVLFLGSGSVMAHMELANMWCILFYAMLLLSALLIIVTQLFSMLTAIFDEFEELRTRKLNVTLTLIGLMALCSIYFCSNHGLIYFIALPADAMFTQTALNLLLLLVVLWVYGRERFQRDIEFMLGQHFATWRIYMLRFIAPLALLITLIICSFIAYYEHFFASVVVIILAVFLIALPWLFIPGYAIFNIVQTSGSFVLRCKRCCRPTDWYPVDAEERQRYEDTMGNMDITHQLNEVDYEVAV